MHDLGILGEIVYPPCHAVIKANPDPYKEIAVSC